MDQEAHTKRTMPLQSAPRLRRKRARPQNFLQEHNLLVPCVVILALVILISAGLMHELVSTASSHTIDHFPTIEKEGEPPSSRNQQHQESQGVPPHLQVSPVLPIFHPIPNQDKLIDDLLHQRKPTIAGIQAYLQLFVRQLHKSNLQLSNDPHREALTIIKAYFALADEYLTPLDHAYRDQLLFPVRDDDSLYLSLAAFREHLLADTLEMAFTHAKHPERLFVGAVVQNCFGRVDPNDYHSIDPSGLPCKTGAQVVGKNAQGRDQTKVSDAPPDMNGIEVFCQKADFQQYCNNGQIRVLYIHETESLGPAVARYYASKLWGGETYFMQVDSHLLYADEWDQKYIDELRVTSNYPKSVLSSYPPGFQNVHNNVVRETPGARLCRCETRMEDPNPIVRINMGASYTGNEPKPTQIPFIAAGFFFVRAEFLQEIPFDPFLPWLFMGEEIALSLRAWTHGWNIYAPRKNLIAHQYRPGRMGLPKFWGTVNRLFHGRPGNNRLQGPLIQRVKHMVGYPGSSRKDLENDERDGNITFVLEEIEHYGYGTQRKWDDYLEFAHMTFDHETNAIVCTRNTWCNKGQKD